MKEANLGRSQRFLTTHIKTCVTAEEKELFRVQSRKSGLSVSEWARQRLIEAAQLTPEQVNLLQQACNVLACGKRIDDA